MRGAAKVEADEHDNLSASCLHFDFAQINSSLTQVQQELLSPVGGLKRQRYRLPAHREICPPVCYAVFFYCNQGIRFCLGK